MNNRPSIEFERMANTHFKLYDHDHNGQLDLNEFRELVNDCLRKKNPRRSVTSLELSIALKKFDHNRDGLVSPTELAQTLLKLPCFL